jgi:ketosteroid isomerase-like protein
VLSAKNVGLQVHLFGATGVVVGWLEIRVATKGGPVLRRYRFTDTWAKRNGTWQIVAAHDYLAPAKR